MIMYTYVHSHRYRQVIVSPKKRVRLVQSGRRGACYIQPEVLLDLEVF